MTDNELETPDSQSVANNGDEAGQPNRGGAPAGNRNATTHGSRGWLALGSLPKGASYVRRLLGEMRRRLETAVLDNSGELGAYELAVVQTACRHEGRALLAGRWLRLEGDSLDVSVRLALLNTIGSASDSRDKCLRLLGLDLKRAANPWASIDSEPLPASPRGEVTKVGDA